MWEEQAQQGGMKPFHPTHPLRSAGSAPGSGYRPGISAAGRQPPPSTHIHHHHHHHQPPHPPRSASWARSRSRFSRSRAEPCGTAALRSRCGSSSGLVQYSSSTSQQQQRPFACSGMFYSQPTPLLRTHIPTPTQPFHALIRCCIAPPPAYYTQTTTTALHGQPSLHGQRNMPAHALLDFSSPGAACAPTACSSL